MCVFLWCFSRRVALSRWVASSCVALLWPRHRVDGVPVSVGLARRIRRAPGRRLPSLRCRRVSRAPTPSPRRSRRVSALAARARLSRRRPRERRDPPTPSTRLKVSNGTPAKYRNVDVVQQVRVVLDGITRREEDHDLLFLAVSFEKREEQPEPILRRDDDVALLEARDRRGSRAGLRRRRAEG